MSQLQIKCNECGATCWTSGYVEPDTNAVVLNENDSYEDGCEHLKNGGEFVIIDEEYDDPS
jgi:hypothetical protein